MSKFLKRNGQEIKESTDTKNKVKGALGDKPAPELAFILNI